MQTGSFTGFTVALDDPGVARITFNTPDRLNGMTTAIKRDLIEALTQAQMSDAVRIIVFTGTGRAFCAGADLKERSSDDPADRDGTPFVSVMARLNHRMNGRRLEGFRGGRNRKCHAPPNGPFIR